jgi:chemotaxis protein histidine kinase CheA
LLLAALVERLKYVRALSGDTILGDGRVGLILVVNGLFDVRESGGGGGHMAVSGHEATAGSADDWGMLAYLANIMP